MLLLALFACKTAEPPAEVPVTLTVTSPTYGEFVGDGPVEVTGVVTPADAQVIVNRRSITPAADGTFTAEVPFSVGADGKPDRALMLDIFALRPGVLQEDGTHAEGDQVRQLIPVFDGVDPRSADPGAIGGLLTPAGLDAMEPLVAAQIDALGWEDQILAALPAITTDYLTVTPVAVTSDGSTVDLSAQQDSVGMEITLNDVTMTTEVTIPAISWTFDMDVTLGQIGVGASADPGLSDDMLTLTLSDAVVDIGEFGFAVDGFELPDWLTELLIDPVLSLIGDLGGTLGDLLLDQLGTIELGGPFAFSTDLMGTPLSARLVDVDANSDGVGLGVTVSTDGDAADALPEDLPSLSPTTPSGLPYELGVSIHEGLFNTLMDQTVSGLLDIDLRLEGTMADLMGGGIEALPGSGEMPEDTEGYCLGIHAGDAHVVRMDEGVGAPLATVWLPDVRFDIDTIQDGECGHWLQTSLFTRLDLSLDGTKLNADLSVESVSVLDYGADGVKRDDVADDVGTLVQGLAGLMMGQLSFDLGDLTGGLGLGGITMNPRVVSIEKLDESGLYGVYLDVF
jgi:hypothetical protein